MSELEKLLETTGTRQTLHEFILWLVNECRIELNVWKHMGSEEADVFVEKFLGLDTVLLNQESLDLELAADYPNGRLP